MSKAQEEFYRDYICRDQRVHAIDRVHRLLAYYDTSSRAVLDIGCATGDLLELIKQRSPQLERAVGIDLGDGVTAALESRGFEGYKGDASEGLPFADHSFDTVICAEVIEHVYNTDQMLREIFRVLRPGGNLLLTTPNLAYLPNRLVLLLGIQPLYTETSVDVNLGRCFKQLGQGGATQGHLKIFTVRALRELLQRTGFEKIECVGYRWFTLGALGLIDDLLRMKTSFAAGLVVRASKDPS